MEISVDNKAVFAATGGQPFDPAQPAIVFIHGAGMDHTVWALQTRYFAYRGRGVLAVDLPGHGRLRSQHLFARPAQFGRTLHRRLRPQHLLAQGGRRIVGRRAASRRRAKAGARVRAISEDEAR